VRTPVFVRDKVKSSNLAPLVARAIDHDMRAWHGFVTLVFPGIEEIAGRFRNAGRLSTPEDVRRDIAVAVIARLHPREGDGLERLVEVCAAGEDSAWPWICRVTQRKAYNYVRDHAKSLGPDEPGGAPRFARLVELSEEVEELLPASVRVVDGIDARAVVTCAERILTKEQLAATRLHLLGDSDATIADALRLSGAHAAGALWRAAVARLRYRFVGRAGGGR
jgi:DNA-directed RNA polymerase specialized sigma24 family protein